MTETPRDLARRQALAVMAEINQILKTDKRVNIAAVAAEAGVAESSLYRWLARPPAKLDIIQVASLVDLLHREYGYEDFARMWDRISHGID